PPAAEDNVTADPVQIGIDSAMTVAPDQHELAQRAEKWRAFHQDSLPLPSIFDTRRFCARLNTVFIYSTPCDWSTRPGYVRTVRDNTFWQLARHSMDSATQ